MKKTIIILIGILLFSCHNQDKEKLKVGIIAPSLNHLPIASGIQTEIFDRENILLVNFSSGWEANEALVAEKIDLAILPFTYIWADVAKGKNVKIISFLERESDGIIARQEIKQISQLDGRKIGVLRASTLDIFAEMLAEKHQINPKLVYFRTPIEMAAALNSGAVDALSFYVPSIFRFDSDYHILHWYGEDFPEHPCCDLATTQTALRQKNTLIRNFLKNLELSVLMLNQNPQMSYKTMQQNYHLANELGQRSLQQTKFRLNLDEAGKSFEAKAFEMMKIKNYITNNVEADDVYWDGLK